MGACHADPYSFLYKSFCTRMKCILEKLLLGLECLLRCREFVIDGLLKFCLFQTDKK